jgi:hypothetical protein
MDFVYASADIIISEQERHQLSIVGKPVIFIPSLMWLKTIKQKR